MKISKLSKWLQEVQNSYGDLECMLDTGDTTAPFQMTFPCVISLTKEDKIPNNPQEEKNTRKVVWL